MLLSTAEEVLGRQRKKIQPWVTNEDLDLCQQRRQLKKQKYSNKSTEIGLEYRNSNREARKKMRAAKEERTEEQCKNIVKGMRSGNSKEAYNTLWRKSTVIKDSSGTILTESSAVLNRWAEYCSSLYNHELHPDTSLLNSNQSPTQDAESLPVPMEKAEDAVHRPRRSVGPQEPLLATVKR